MPARNEVIDWLAIGAIALFLGWFAMCTPGTSSVRPDSGSLEAHDEWWWHDHGLAIALDGGVLDVHGNGLVRLHGRAGLQVEIVNPEADGVIWCRQHPECDGGR